MRNDHMPPPPTHTILLKEWQTDTTENITFPQFRSRAVKMSVMATDGGFHTTTVTENTESCRSLRSVSKDPFGSIRNRSGIIAREGLPNAKPLIVDFILMLPETNF